MNTSVFAKTCLIVLCAAAIAVGGAYADQPSGESLLRLQSLAAYPGLDDARLDAVGRAVGFRNWKQTADRRAAFAIDKSWLSSPELVTREATGYDVVDFDGAPWGKSQWTCARLVENTRALPSELPTRRKEALLAMLSPEQRADSEFVKAYLARKLKRYIESQRYLLEGEMDVRFCLAPDCRAAQEHMLVAMIENALPTDGLIRTYAAGKRPKGLGNVSFSTESSSQDDMLIRFVRDNVSVSVRAHGCFVGEVLPLARKIEAALVGLPSLSSDQLLARRPALTMSSHVDEATPKSGNLRAITYDISTPPGQGLVSVRTSDELLVTRITKEFTVTE